MKLPIHNRIGDVIAWTKVDKDIYKRFKNTRLRLVKGVRNNYVAFAKKKETFYLHRLITNAPKGKDVDHLNKDSLDNRRKNLCICTRAENLWNRRKNLNGKDSCVVGVSQNSNCSTWIYQRMRNGVRIRKNFKTKQEAEKYAKANR